MSCEAFDLAWFHVKETIPYKKTWEPDWHPKKGYVSAAVAGRSAPKLKPGQMVKTEVMTPSPFRLIIIGTPFGNMVIFDSPTGQGAKVTSPAIVQKLYGRSRDIHPRDIAFYTGIELGERRRDNVGTRLNAVFSETLALFVSKKSTNVI